MQTTWRNWLARNLFGTKTDRHHSSNPGSRRGLAKRTRLRVEGLEQRDVPAVIFNEGFEGAFPGDNWSTNTSQGRTWEDVNYKAHSGGWSGFGSYRSSTDHTYVNSMSAYMERTVSLAGYTSPILTFYDSLNTEAGYDPLRVKVNGTEVWRDSGNKPSWSAQSISLASYAGQSNVTVRFEFTSDPSVVPAGDAGAWVDDITLSATPAVQQQPDLGGWWCTVPNSAQWGQTLTVQQAQIRNVGSGAAGPFQVQWYLSRDSLGSSDDILLPLANGVGIAYSHSGIAGNSYGPLFSVNLQLPGTLPSGWGGANFYVVMKTDSANQVSESNENNNFGQVGNSYDWAPVTITMPFADITAFRPQQGAGSYGPFPKTEVSEADDQNSQLGPGIRINRDDDNSNGVEDRYDATVNGENDLIEVRLKASGGNYILQRTSPNLRVWTSPTKGSEIAFSNNQTNTILSAASGPAELPVWVEWAGASQGTADLTFRPASGSPASLPQDTVTFHTFRSDVVVLGGQGQRPEDLAQNASNYGTFQNAVLLYQLGYDVHMYDQALVNFGLNSYSGLGPVRDEILNAVNRRGVTNLAVFGYSYGGGATYRLAERLAQDRDAGVIGSYTLAFTAYIDGVREYPTPLASETRRPQRSLYHLNYYETNTWYLRGAFVDGATNVDVTAPGMTHWTIDDALAVLTGVRLGLVSMMPTR
jgi:hypothetical protein